MPEAVGEPSFEAVAAIIEGMAAGVEPDTPAAFLDELALALKDTFDIDTELAEILSHNLLTVSPAVDAVATAKAKIVALAAKRAAPAEPGAKEACHG